MGYQGESRDNKFEESWAKLSLWKRYGEFSTLLGLEFAVVYAVGWLLGWIKSLL